MLVTLLVFLVVLGFMVFVHELGHFLVAKRNGVRVEEFAFGFRPRLFARKKGETTYAINLIPLGGYVKMYGEQQDEKGPGSYRSKSIAKRLAILVAGSAMNLLTAWVILTALFAVGFHPFIPAVAENPFISEAPKVEVGRVTDNSPAQEVGIQAGDIVLTVNQEKITSDVQFVELVNKHRGQLVTVGLERDGKELTKQVLARENPPAGQGAVGVGIGLTGEARSSLIAAPAAGLYETGRIIGLSAKGFVDFAGNLLFKQEVSEDVTGIIGAGALTGVARRLGFEYLAQLVALISVGLGVVNLMPILPLDGGHIAALAYEKVARRPLSERQFGLLASVGLAFVLLVFLVVTYQDIIRFNIIGRFF